MIDQTAKDIIGRTLEVPEDLVQKASDPQRVLNGEKSEGGSSPKEVKKIIQNRVGENKEERERLEKRHSKIKRASGLLDSAAKQIMRKSESYVRC
jgi:hypothetical protein